jgi:Glyoxalase superfamily protein
MSSIEQLKSEAAALEAKARAQGHPMKHCDALEQVARNHGYDSWRACRAILGDPASASSTALPERPPINNIEMKRYASKEWNFALDIPARWNVIPAVVHNNPHELIRFGLHEDGVHNLIIFRNRYDPEKGQQAFIEFIEGFLVKAGFGNFVAAETTIGSSVVPTLDFDKPDDKGDTWRVRHYFVFHGTVAYEVSFGTTEWHAMVGLFDRIAKTFVVDDPQKPTCSPGISAAYRKAEEIAQKRRKYVDAANDNRLVE